MFSLHPRLEKGTHLIGRRDSCLVLLKDNSVFPWLLIVPEVEADIEDLHQLPLDHFNAVTSLIRDTSTFVTDHFAPEKLNVACIGNMVRQMHIHIVGRSSNDPAWPGTVWASDAKSPWPSEAIPPILKAAQNHLQLQ